ncbi:MAG: four helix bundle protein [Terriglobales bacterium]
MRPEAAEELRSRTKRFANRIVRLCEAMRNNPTGRPIANQLIRSGTSVGANYRAACRSRSEAEFVARTAVALEEADETAYWPELLVEAGVVPTRRMPELMKECDELIRIFSAARHTTQARIRSQNSKFKIQNSCDGRHEA